MITRVMSDWYLFKIATGLSLVMGVTGMGVGYVVAELTDQPSLAARALPVTSEDGAAWDGLRQGNHVMGYEDLMIFNITSLPADPYERCLVLIGLSVFDGGIELSPDSVCEPLYPNR